MPGMSDQFRHRGTFDHASGIHDCDPVGKLGNDPQIVSYKYDGSAVFTPQFFVEP